MIIKATYWLKVLRISLALFIICSWSILSAQSQNLDLAPMILPHGAYDPPKNFQEKTANFFMSKRFKTSARQRDSLYELTASLRNDTFEMAEDLKWLQQDTATTGNALRNCQLAYDSLSLVQVGLRNDYKALQKVSSQTQKFLSNELSEKATKLELLERELAQREKRLNELEDMIRKQDSITNAIHNTIKKALLQFDAEDLSVELKNGKVYVSLNDKILFASGKAEVGENGIKAINKLTDILQELDVDIMVEGHTDNVPIKTPQFQDNWDLSSARAIAITRLMIELGVNPKRTIASGRSEFSPKISNETAPGRAKNRRTEIVLIPNLDALYNLISSKSTN